MKSIFKKIEPPKEGPNILLFDLETSPTLGFFWRLYQEVRNVEQIVEDTYTLCFSAKWLGKPGVMQDALPAHSADYKKNPEDDSKILKNLYDLINEADWIIAHNGDKFDMPYMNARLIYNGFSPPNPVRQIDTLKIARQIFRFSSNRLDYLGEFLGVGRKRKTDGFPMWKSCCLEKDLRAWNQMVRYNKQDVILLEKVYNKLAPWTKSHPNFGLYVDDNNPVCTLCGSAHLERRGYAETSVGLFQRYHCLDCGKWPRGRYSLVSKEKKTVLLTNTM